MKENVKKEIKKLIKIYELNCSVEEFKDKVNKLIWGNISKYEKVSEDFMEEFQDKMEWYCISRFQWITRKFIKKFENRLDMEYLDNYHDWDWEDKVENQKFIKKETKEPEKPKKEEKEKNKIIKVKNKFELIRF